MADRIVSEKFLDEILGYLANQPYREVFMLIAGIHNLPKKEEPNAGNSDN